MYASKGVGIRGSEGVDRCIGRHIIEWNGMEWDGMMVAKWVGLHSIQGIRCKKNMKGNKKRREEDRDSMAWMG